MPAAEWPPEASERTFIVILEAKAGFRLEGDENITVVASDDSELPVAGVRLRNKQTWAPEFVRREDAQTFVGAIVVEAAGRFATAEDAVAVLPNLANPYLHVLAVIANAAVEEPEDLLVYAPPEGANGEGEFLVQRHSQPRAPAARLRPLAAKDAMAVLQALQVHPRAERLHRTMAHVRMALNHLAPESRVLSAESLWMAIENLTRVVFDRLCHEHGIDPSAPDAKHRLARTLGFEPRTLDVRSPEVQALIDSGALDSKSFKRDNSHLDALDAHIRVNLILGGDQRCYKQLKAMSDGFEHGYMSFGDVRKKSEVADAAFTHLRRSLLAEIGLKSDSPLFDGRFNEPQAVWRPVLQARGVYTDAADRRVSLSRESFTEPWPDPPGLSLVPMMTGVLDTPDGHRQITLQVNGTTDAMPATQTASVTSAMWIAPGFTDGKLLDRETTVRLNGDVVEDAIELESTLGSDRDPG